MLHLNEADSDRTVIAVQVENEIGILGADRDFCSAANRAFAQPVPQPVADWFGVRGSWEEAFGRDGAEMMMAWQYGSAVEQIASQGKSVYPLPLYVNAWLQQHPDRPGKYPCGGPVAKMPGHLAAGGPVGRLLRAGHLCQRLPGGLRRVRRRREPPLYPRGAGDQRLGILPLLRGRQT